MENNMTLATQLSVTPDQARALCAISNELAYGMPGFDGAGPSSKMTEAAGFIFITNDDERVEAYDEDGQGWFALKDDNQWDQY